MRVLPMIAAIAMALAAAMALSDAAPVTVQSAPPPDWNPTVNIAQFARDAMSPFTNLG
jgi:hypothetical protein